MQMRANHSRSCAFIRQAAKQGCHVAGLPEYHLTGWEPDDSRFRAAASHSPSYLEAYRALARECNICIVPGTLVERHPAVAPNEPDDNGNDNDDIFVNTAYFISHTGAILHAYHKKNIWHSERAHLTTPQPHAPHRAFDTPIGRVGLLICWDLGFPEAFRELIADGATIIIIASFWAMGAPEDAGMKWNVRAEAVFIESVLVARAFENGCIVVFANAGGPATDSGEAGKADVGGVGEDEKGKATTGGSEYAGLSQVAMPFLGAQGKLGVEEEMAVVEVDMQIVADAEENYKVREDLRREGWHYQYAQRSDRTSDI